MKNLLFFLFLLLTGFIHAQNSSNLSVREVGKSNGSESHSERNFRATIGGGYAYRLGKIDKTGDTHLDDFNSSLRNGYNLDIELQYFFQENMGVALNGNFIKQSKTESITNITESHKFVYVGPSYVLRFEKNKLGLYLGAGFGPLFYTISEKTSPLEVSLNKTAFGSYLGVSGEYRISQNVGAGLKISATAGSVKIPELGTDSQNVSNLMITGFISFRSK